MSAAEALTAFTALFVVIDPIGLTPIFAALTAGLSARARNAIAFRALGLSALILVVFAVSGESLLGFLGISMPAFRIAGGLLLFLTALEMLFERRQERRDGNRDVVVDDPSVFPLALPLIAGPGAIATMILLTDGGDAMNVASAVGVMLAVLGVCLVLFQLAAPMERALGRVGINVVTRLLGMLLAALSVQFVLDGVLAIW
ncbi:MarC family protein [Jannaschia sp. LMIT008]|uniref:MarC family protein n=1 Tax=Jannaschia maritima TaxID=3032585 RepID=UPI002810E856|nr:MarC family protein [Jannaschia sp. LMIT008]